MQQSDHGTRLCFAPYILSVLTEFMETGDACGWDSCEYLPPMIHISVCFGIDRSPHDLPARSIDGRGDVHTFIQFLIRLAD